MRGWTNERLATAVAFGQTAATKHPCQVLQFRCIPLPRKGTTVRSYAARIAAAAAAIIAGLPLASPAQPALPDVNNAIRKALHA